MPLRLTITAHPDAKTSALLYSISARLFTVLANQEKTMSSLTDLTDAVAGLDTAVTANSAATTAAVSDIAALAAQIASLNGGANPAIDAAVADITARTSDIAAANKALNDAVSPPSPEPDPAP